MHTSVAYTTVVLRERDSLLLGLLVATTRCTDRLRDSRFLDQVVDGLFMFDGMNGREPLVVDWMYTSLTSEGSLE